MLQFLIGLAVGAGGFWAYKFWKGEDDTSWDQSFSSSGTGSNSYSSHESEPAGAGTMSGTSTMGSSEGSTPPKS